MVLRSTQSPRHHPRLESLKKGWGTNSPPETKRGLQHSRAIPAIALGNQGDQAVRRGQRAAGQELDQPPPPNWQATRHKAETPGRGKRDNRQRISQGKAQRASLLPNLPNDPHFEPSTFRQKRAKPGASVHLCQFRPPPRSPPPERTAPASDRDMGPANSFPSNPALPPPANQRHGRRAPLPHHVTVTRVGSWGKRQTVGGRRSVHPCGFRRQMGCSSSRLTGGVSFVLTLTNNYFLLLRCLLLFFWNLFCKVSLAKENPRNWSGWPQTAARERSGFDGGDRCSWTRARPEECGISCHPAGNGAS